MFETGVTRKTIADSGTTQHLIANLNLIRHYYDDYSEYQIGSGEVLPSYGKGTLFLPLDNGFLKLASVWYAPDLGFNLISSIQLGKKGVEMWLRTTDQSSQILHNGDILGYADPIDGQFVFQLKYTLESTVFANSADKEPKKEAKPGDIELWHFSTRVWERLRISAAEWTLTQLPQASYVEIVEKETNSPAIQKHYV